MQELRTLITASVLLLWALMAILNVWYDIVPVDSAPAGTLREHLLYSVWYMTISLGIWTLLKMTLHTVADAIAGNTRFTRVFSTLVLVTAFIGVPGRLTLLHYGFNLLWAGWIMLVALLVTGVTLWFERANRRRIELQPDIVIPESVRVLVDRQFLHEVIRPPVATATWLAIFSLVAGVVSYVLIELRILPFQWPPVQQSLFDATALVGAFAICYTLVIRWLWYITWNDQLENSTILILLLLIAVPAAVTCWYIYKDLAVSFGMWFLGGIGLVVLTVNASLIMKTYITEELIRKTRLYRKRTSRK